MNESLWGALALVVVAVWIGFRNTRSYKRDSDQYQNTKREEIFATVATPEAQMVKALIESSGYITGSETDLKTMCPVVLDYSFHAVRVLKEYQALVDDPADFETIEGAVDETIRYWDRNLLEHTSTVLERDKGTRIVVSAAWTVGAMVPPAALHLMVKLDRNRSRFSTRILEGLEPDLHEALIGAARSERNTNLLMLRMAQIELMEQILMRAAGVPTQR